jgi:hypothetical protein
VWRDSLGQNVPNGSGADGDFDGLITTDDYEVWLARFGETIPGTGSASGGVAPAPEPLTATMLIIGLFGGSLFQCRAISRVEKWRGGLGAA